MTGFANHYNGSTYSDDFATARFLGDSTSRPTSLAPTVTPSETKRADPILVPLVLDEALFLDVITSGKHRHACAMRAGGGPGDSREP